jgi:hypothetical protein
MATAKTFRTPYTIEAVFCNSIRIPQPVKRLEYKCLKSATIRALAFEWESRLARWYDFGNGALRMA